MLIDQMKQASNIRKIDPNQVKWKVNQASNIPDWITIDPPTHPKENGRKNARLTALVDISWSMKDPATLKDKNGQDVYTGFDLLAVVKRALAAFVFGLAANDEFAIVVFSTTAHVLFPLTRMTEDAKKTALDLIDNLKAAGQTYLWKGIEKAMDLMQFARKDAPRDNIIEDIFIFTDGQPTDDYRNTGYVVSAAPSRGSLKIKYL
jgi:hypothetical protein